MLKSQSGARHARPPRQTGASLIEVLVSILIVSFGLLAMAAMQANAVKFNKTSELRAVATLLARDLGDRIKANSVGGIPPAGAYQLEAEYSPLDSAPSTPGCAIADNCTDAEIAAQDLAEWQQALFHSLPEAAGFVQVRGATAPVVVDIWVAWRETEGDSPRGSAGAGRDECPAAFVDAAGDNLPRCLYFSFAL